MSVPTVQGRERYEPVVLFVKNVNGGDLAPGDAVMFTITGETDHDAEKRTVIDATVAGENRFAGVVLGRGYDGGNIPDDEFGYVVYEGLCRLVTCEADTVTAGEELFVSATAGELIDVSATGEGTTVVAIALIDSASSVVTEAVVRP